MSQLSVATVSQLRTIQQLVRMGRYAYCGVADEDMPGILAKRATILAAEREAMWGVMMVDPRRARLHCRRRRPTTPSSARWRCATGPGSKRGRAN